MGRMVIPIWEKLLGADATILKAMWMCSSEAGWPRWLQVRARVCGTALSDRDAFHLAHLIDREIARREGVPTHG